MTWYIMLCLRLATCFLLIVSSCRAFGRASTYTEFPGEVGPLVVWLGMAFLSAFLAVAVLFVS
jgi:hypothetical protein